MHVWRKAKRTAPFFRFLDSVWKLKLYIKRMATVKNSFICMTIYICYVGLLSYLFLHTPYIVKHFFKNPRRLGEPMTAPPGSAFDNRHTYICMHTLEGGPRHSHKGGDRVCSQARLGKPVFWPRGAPEDTRAFLLSCGVRSLSVRISKMFILRHLPPPPLLIYNIRFRRSPGGQDPTFGCQLVKILVIYFFKKGVKLADLLGKLSKIQESSPRTLPFKLFWICPSTCLTPSN